MSHSVQRARLQLTPLDDRIVPSTVNATTTARPFDFTGAGTLATNDQLGDTAPVLDTATNTVRVNGVVNYTDNTTGQSGPVTVTGTGVGAKHQDSNPDAAENSYAQTLVGKFSFEDASGAVTTIEPLTMTETWLAPDGTGGTDLYGPVAAAGTFDTSTFKLLLDWDSPSGSDVLAGNLTVTLANKTTVPTDLAFSSTSASLNAAGNVDLDFTVAVSGQLPKAPSHTATIARVTAIWEGNGKSETAEIDLPVYWNTGTIAVAAQDLAAPTWAQTLTVKLDAAGLLAEGDEANNSWTVTLGDLTVPAAPPAVPPPMQQPPVVAPPAAPAAGDPPLVPIDPNPVLAGFSLTPGQAAYVEWRDATGRMFGTVQAMTGFEGPVTLAAGDVNGDGVMDAAVAAGSGGGPRVRVLDGRTGHVLTDFFAYDAGFRGGVHIAMADLNQDGHSEIIAGAGAGGGPHVRVFDGATGQVISQFFAYNADFRGGVRVAAGDLDGDGVAEIITGTGAGGGPVLGVFDGLAGSERFRQMVGDEDHREGLEVAAATDAADVVIVTADPDGDGPAKRFRSQLNPTEPLLVELMDAAIPPPPVFLG